jgi:hypothetical protein
MGLCVACGVGKTSHFSLLWKGFLDVLVMLVTSVLSIKNAVTINNYGFQAACELILLVQYYA